MEGEGGARQNEKASVGVQRTCPNLVRRGRTTVSIGLEETGTTGHRRSWPTSQVVADRPSSASSVRDHRNQLQRPTRSWIRETWPKAENGAHIFRQMFERPLQVAVEPRHRPMSGLEYDVAIGETIPNTGNGGA